MRKDPLYYEGYIAGYRDGVKDAISGKTDDWQSSELGKLPIHAMAISTRACNCLVRCGCTYVEDVVALSAESIMRMRNLGRKSAAEIAPWLTEHGILCSAWSEYA